MTTGAMYNVIKVLKKCSITGKIVRQYNKYTLFRNQGFMLDEMIQNSPYFWNMKNLVVFFSFFISCYFIFSLMNELVYVDIDRGIH